MANLAEFQYEPVQLGGQQGLRVSGPQGSQVFFGKPAAEFKARIDAAKSAMPQPLAGPPVPGAMGAQSLQAGDTSARQGATPQETPQTAQAGPKRLIGGEVLTDQGAYQYRPSTAGISQEKLQKTSSQAVEMPAGTQTTTTGGFAPDAEYVRATEETAQQDVSNARERQALAQQQAAANRDAAQAEMFAAGERLRQKQEYEAQVKAEVDAAEQRRATADAEFKSGRVDPKRIFGGNTGALRKIGAAIASALGAFGAAMTGTRNFAQDAIQAAIDSEIDAQKEEIRIKGAAADNALKDLMDRRMTAGQAELALRSAMEDHVAASARWTQAQYGTQEAQVQGDDLINQRLKAANDAREAYRQASLGEATKTVSSRYAYPQAGTPGRWVRMSGAQTRAAIKGDQEIQAGPGGTRTPPETALKVTNQLSADTSAAEAALDYADALGEEKGAGEASTFWGPSWTGQKRRAIDTAYERAMNERMGQTGLDAKRVQADLEGNGSRAARLSGAEGMATDSVRRITATLRGLPPTEANTQLETIPPRTRALVKQQLRGAQ